MRFHFVSVPGPELKPNIVKADFHSVQFSERADLCDRFLLKCVLLSGTSFIG